jgi:pyocin large subunit-like protein
VVILSALDFGMGAGEVYNMYNRYATLNRMVDSRGFIRSGQNVNFAPGRPRDPVVNLNRHWESHRSEFPQLKNAYEYQQATEKFVTSPPRGTLIRELENNRKAFYNPSTNTLGFTDRGKPASMYKPDPSVHGKSSNMEYFNSLR